MKKGGIFFLSIAITISCFAQDTTRPAISKLDYLQKSQNQKRTAWIMMGSGIAIFTGGIIYTAAGVVDAGLRSTDGGTEQTSALGPILILGGAGLMLGSIPVFVASSRNHKRAMSLQASTETIDFFKQTKFANPYYSAVSLVIPIGKK